MTLPELLKNLLTLGLTTPLLIEIYISLIYTIYGIGFPLISLSLK